MKTETQFRALIVILSMLLIIMTFEYFEKDRVYEELKVSTSKQMDSLKIMSDSLIDENFNLKVEIGRHELTRNEFFRKHKGSEEEYNLYYEHETE